MPNVTVKPPSRPALPCTEYGGDPCDYCQANPDLSPKLVTTLYHHWMTNMSTGYWPDPGESKVMSYYEIFYTLCEPVPDFDSDSDSWEDITSDTEPDMESHSAPDSTTVSLTKGEGSGMQNESKLEAFVHRRGPSYVHWVDLARVYAITKDGTSRIDYRAILNKGDPPEDDGLCFHPIRQTDDVEDLFKQWDEVLLCPAGAPEPTSVVEGPPVVEDPLSTGRHGQYPWYSNLDRLGWHGPEFRPGVITFLPHPKTMLLGIIPGYPIKFAPPMLYIHRDRMANQNPSRIGKIELSGLREIAEELEAAYQRGEETTPVPYDTKKPRPRVCCHHIVVSAGGYFDICRQMEKIDRECLGM